jgi:hypothetical protein
LERFDEEEEEEGKIKDVVEKYLQPHMLTLH